MVASGQIMDYQPYFLLQRLAPCHNFKGFAFLGSDVKSGHPVFVRIGEVNLAVLGLGATSFTGTRTFVDVIQTALERRRLISEKPISFSPSTNGSVEKAASATSKLRRYRGAQVHASQPRRSLTRTDRYGLSSSPLWRHSLDLWR